MKGQKPTVSKLALIVLMLAALAWSLVGPCEEAASQSVLMTLMTVPVVSESQGQEKLGSPGRTAAQQKKPGKPAGTQGVKPARRGRPADKPGGEKVAASSSVEQELIELDQEWCEAGIRGDTAALEPILADDFIGSGATGLTTKAQTIAQAKSDSANIANATYKADEYTVRLLDQNTAIMFHRAVEKGQNKGADYTDRHWSIHVWKKQNGRWQVVASQTTPLSPQPAQ